jgi:hypothetical protein
LVGKDLLQKHLGAARRKKQDTNYPENGSIEVCIVVDVVLSLLPLYIGINQKKAAQKKARKAEYPK